ncbi:hypothetical protein B0H14DRAFT_149570 [Mycena olivaceomarginata]|nr:hypothetical protein B0H14DRAFT_149570 [Mycena olivaceomarginata]
MAITLNAKRIEIGTITGGFGGGGGSGDVGGMGGEGGGPRFEIYCEEGRGFSNISGGTGGAGGSGTEFGGQGGTGKGPYITRHRNSASSAGAVLYPEFRTIPLGEIHLLEEIGSKPRTRDVGRLGRKTSVRRVYSARVERQWNTTVAMYQGDGAEEEWRQDMQHYLWLRHPSFVQLYGLMSSSMMYAAVFHDDLIPLEYFMELYECSHQLTVYLNAYCVCECTRPRDGYHRFTDVNTISPHMLLGTLAIPTYLQFQRRTSQHGVSVLFIWR